ncbi:MAG: transmembrane 220 family protein, partial [Bacteroidota bacterium]
MRILYIVLSVLFTLFGLVQINDVDPWFWVSYYLFIAVLMGAASFGQFRLYGFIVASAITLISLVRLLPDFQAWVQDGMPSIVESMKAETPYVEFVREFLGLFIVLLALVLLFVQRKKV